MGSAPLVSIAMPVYNGQRYLRAALDSLLAQTLTDLEICITDNASTDTTEDICRAYVAADGRVRYVRNERNIGAGANYNRCMELTTGKYVRWHAYDDVCSPEYLARCVEVLDGDPSVSNCHSRVTVIDEAGATIEKYDFPIGTDAPRASARFARVIHTSHRGHRNYEVFGLMRREQLFRWMPQGCFAHADRLMTVQLVLSGRLHEVPERLFLARWHPGQSMQYVVEPNLLRRYLGRGPLPPTEWWDPSRKGRLEMPEWRILGKYASAVARAPVGPADKARCVAHLAWWAVRKAPKLGRDLLFAAEHVLTAGRHDMPAPAQRAQPAPAVQSDIRSGPVPVAAADTQLKQSA